MRPRAGAPGHPGTSSRRRIRALWVAAAVLFTPVAVLLVLSLVVAVVVLVSAGTGGPLPAALQPLLDTGPLGDTFGGLLGPLLNAMVLGTTVAIALDQGRQARRAQLDAEDRFRAELDFATRREEVARAATVVAWVAETRHQDASHLGVVVTNAGDTLVRNLDLLIGVDHVSTPLTLRNRESVVPPGTWFLQLDRERSERDPADDADEPSGSGWPIPLAVDTDGQLRVWLPVGEDTADEQALALHVHPPEKIDGEHLPYYRLEALRFELQGSTWWRDSDGALMDAPPPSLADAIPTWEQTFAPLASTPRTAVTAPRRMHEKNPEVQDRVGRIAAALTGLEPGRLVQGRRHDASAALRAAGIVQLRVAGGGQGIAFFAGAREDEPVLWMAGSARSGVVPAGLHVVPRHSRTGPHCRLGALRKELADLDDPVRFAAVFTQRIAANRERQGTLCGCDPQRARAEA